MDKKQSAHYESSLRADIFMVKYETELSAIGSYVILRGRFSGTLEDLEIAKQRQFEQTHYITTDKTAARSDMAHCVYKNAIKAAAQTFALNMPDLVMAFDKSLTYFNIENNNLSFGRSREIYQLLDTHKATLTELIAADFAEMDAKIIAFEAVKALPMNAIKSKKAEGTDAIPGFTTSLEEDKKMIGKVVEGHLSAHFTEWQDEVKIGKPIGARKLSIGMHYADEMTGVDLSKIKISVSNGVDTIVKHTTVRGWLHVYSLTSGNYTITAELPTYQVNVKTNVGVNEEGPVYLEFVMKKIVI